MNKLTRLVIATLVVAMLSMPAFAKGAKGATKAEAQTTHAKKKSSTAVRQSGKMGASNTAAPAKAKSSKTHSAKKGSTAASHTAHTSKKPARGSKKARTSASTSKVKTTGKKSAKNQKGKS
jgi:hypothetical protein